MKEPRTTRQRWHAADRFETSQAMFRDAAYALIRSGSVTTVSMRGLAASVGASPMTAYRYYPDKDALIADVRRLAWEDFARHLESAGTKGRSDVERFRSMCRGYLAFAIDLEPVYRLLFASLPPVGAVNPTQPEGAHAWQLLLGVVSGLDRRLRDGEVLGHAHLTWSSLHGLSMLHLSRRLVGGRSVDEVLETIMASLIVAISGHALSPTVGMDAAG